MSELLTLFPRVSSATPWKKLMADTFFHSLPRAQTIGEDWNVESTRKSKAFPQRFCKITFTSLSYHLSNTLECHCCGRTDVTFQSSEGSLTNTSMVFSKRSGWALYARREWTMTLWIKPDSFNGCIRFRNCWVSRKGMSSGTGRNCEDIQDCTEDIIQRCMCLYQEGGVHILTAGHIHTPQNHMALRHASGLSLLPSIKRLWLTCVAEPNAWPKSIPIMPPVSMLIMKLERWRSPIPRTQWLTHSKAWELMKWERKERKASGLLHIFKKALLQIEKRRKLFSPNVKSSFIKSHSDKEIRLTSGDHWAQAATLSKSCWQCQHVLLPWQKNKQN